MPRIIPYTVILILTGIIVGLNIQPTPNTSVPALPITEPKVDLSHINTTLLQLQSQINLLNNKLTNEVEQNNKINDQLASLKINLEKLKVTTDVTELPNKPNAEMLTNNDLGKPRLTEPQRRKKILFNNGC